MAANSGSFLHFTANGDTGTLGGAGSGQMLNSVNVGTAGVSSVLTLRVGSSTGAIISVLDASAKATYQFGFMVNGGVYCALTGGNADVTIG